MQGRKLVHSALLRRLALGALLFCASCQEPTVIVVTVETDLVPGADFDTLRIVADDAMIVRPNVRDIALFEISATDERVSFPLSFSLRPRVGTHTEITVEGRDAHGNAIVSQSAQVTFRSGRTTVLRMDLTASCRFLTAHCVEASTCRRGKCVTRDRLSEALPDVVPGLELEGLEGPPASEARHIQRTCRDFGAVEGCGVEYLEGGTFPMGDAAAIDASPPITVTVDPFVMDRFEVTIDRLAVFRSDGERVLLTMTVPYPDGAAIDTAFASFDLEEGCDSPPIVLGDARPVVCFPWDTATQFCAFEGGRLPTSAEWEYAARHRLVEGLSSPRTYPWGNMDPASQAPCELAHFEGCDASGDAVEVGSLLASGNIFDLAGNVAEWTSDRYVARGGDCFPLRPLSNPTCLPSTRVAQGDMIVRGGGIEVTGVVQGQPDAPRRALMGASITRVVGDARHPAVGFRCVYDR